SLEERVALDDAVVLQLVGDLEKEHATTVGVRELAATEAHGDLELVAFVEEPRRRPDLRVDVVVVDLRRHAHLFPRDRLLALLRFLRFLLLLEAVLPEVEDLRDGRDRVRRDLDEVVAQVLRVRERTLRRKDAELFAVGADEAHGRDADLFVDPQFRRGYRADSAIRRGTPLALEASTRRRISPRQQPSKALLHARPVRSGNPVHHARPDAAVERETVVPQLAFLHRSEAFDRAL